MRVLFPCDLKLVCLFIIFEDAIDLIIDRRRNKNACDMQSCVLDVCECQCIKSCTYRAVFGVHQCEDLKVIHRLDGRHCCT